MGAAAQDDTPDNVITVTPQGVEGDLESVEAGEDGETPAKSTSVTTMPAASTTPAATTPAIKPALVATTKAKNMPVCCLKISFPYLYVCSNFHCFSIVAHGAFITCQEEDC